MVSFRADHGEQRISTNPGVVVVAHSRNGTHFGYIYQAVLGDQIVTDMDADHLSEDDDVTVIFSPVGNIDAFNVTAFR